MTTRIIVPELGESVVEARVARWLKKEGDPVAVGDAVVELETEKVNVEVGAEQAGVLARIEHKDGDDVHPGDVLGVIEPVPAGAPMAAGAVGTGSAPAQKEPAAKAQVEGPAARAAAQDGATTSEIPPDGSAADVAAGEKATPVARRLADEYRLDLADVSGTGPGGRITKQDVEAFMQRQGAAREAAAPSAPAPSAPVPPAPASAAPATTAPAAEQPPAPSPPVSAQSAPVRAEPTRPTEASTPTRPEAAPAAAASAGRLEERIRMSLRRKTIARRLVEAQHAAAMLTTFNEVDMSAVVRLRQQYKETFHTRYGVSLGFVSFFVKAALAALKEFPRLNAELQGDEIVLKSYYDIGIAVGAEEGLVVPVLRDADRLSFAEIEQTIKALVQKAEDSSLSLEDLRGGTFTITNGGVFGSLLSTPILNPPQVGILGLHRVQERPVAHEGQVVIRPMMYVALSYDHRIVDGREAVQFLVRVKECVEDPMRLLFVT